jgi:2-polyprenyl-3-methyl-5-hydroxy-6-metoxy-1,4-benzoquinol methylase
VKAPVTLEDPEGRVVVEEVGSGRRRVSVELTDPSVFMAEPVVETNYPVDLIAAILDLRGAARLGYSIRRAEDPSVLAEPLRHYTLAYVGENELEGKRLLDFGCGSGSSTVALAQLFPRTEIVAVDLEEGNIAVARLRATHYGVGNATFLASPGPFELPDDIGTFDFVCLSAVYEHLLPAERPVLMAKLWRALRPRGVLFLNQTPHRYYPLEYHTTGLPLLNYLPARAALPVARRLSRRVERKQTWDDLLRDGVRGATDRQILRHLRAAGDGAPTLLRPSRLGFRDQADLWYSLSTARRTHWLKRPMRTAFKLVGRVTGSSFVPTLALAIRKA